MNVRFVTSVLLIAFISLAGVALYVPVAGHAGHHTDCPFAQKTATMCATPLAHLEHWRSALTATLVEVLVLTVVVAFFVGVPFPTPKGDPQYQRYRFRARVPRRPSLLQELLSRGILNPKIPWPLSIHYSST